MCMCVCRSCVHMYGCVQVLCVYVWVCVGVLCICVGVCKFFLYMYVLCPRPGADPWADPSKPTDKMRGK